MGAVTAYAQVVQAVIPRASWDETHFSLLSLKSRLQAVPGFQRLDIWARDQDGGDVQLMAVTNWDYPDQLALWLGQGLTVDSILQEITPPPLSLSIDLYEEIC